MEVAAPMSVAASASVDVQDLRRELSAVLEVLRTDKP
jgi:hypothetical protein